MIKVAVSDYGKTIYTILTSGLEMRSIEKEGRCLAFTSTTKHEIRQFHAVVVQRRQRNWMYRKALCTPCRVVHGFANLTYCLFVLPSSLLKLPLASSDGDTNENITER